MLQGRFEAAIADYTMAVQLNPQHCRAYYNRAFSHDRLNRFEDAIADYSRALDIEPGNATALHNRGSLFERLGRLQEALHDFSQAISMERGGAGGSSGGPKGQGKGGGGGARALNCRRQRLRGAHMNTRHLCNQATCCMRHVLLQAQPGVPV